MKKNNTCIFFACAVLLLTGCSSQVQPELELTAETIPAETEPEYEQLTDDEFRFYDDYESFAAEFRRIYPDMYLYEFPTDCPCEITQVILCSTNYNIKLRDTERDELFALEIDFTVSYPTIEEFMNFFDNAIIVEDNQFEQGSDRYLWEHYEVGGTDMYGITGAENIAFALYGLEQGALLQWYEQLKL